MCGTRGKLGRVQTLDMSSPLSPRFVDDAALETALVPQSAFLRALENAITARDGFAAGKIGYTELQLLSLVMKRRQNAPSAQLRLIELWLKAHAVQFAGIFPDDPDLFFSFAELYLQ